MCISRPKRAYQCTELLREKALSACLSIPQAVGGSNPRNMTLDTRYNALH